MSGGVDIEPNDYSPRLHLPTFFAYVRRAPFGGRLSKSQVDGLERLLGHWATDGTGDDRHLAYMLATGFHETGGRMHPVRETFATSDAQAIRRLDAAMAAGRLRQVSKPYWREGWFGRGDVQVTHERNYRIIGRALGIDLLENPGLMLDPDISARAMIVGMREGLFSQGQMFARYFNATTDDPVGARRIVNGADKASLIAGYYRSFLDSIIASRKEAAKSVPAVVAPHVPDGADLKKDPVAIGGVLAGAGALGGMVTYAKPVLESINSPWAFAFAAMIAVGVFLVLTGRVQLKVRGGV